MYQLPATLRPNSLHAGSSGSSLRPTSRTRGSHRQVRSDGSHRLPVGKRLAKHFSYEYAGSFHRVLAGDDQKHRQSIERSQWWLPAGDDRRRSSDCDDSREKVRNRGGSGQCHDRTLLHAQKEWQGHLTCALSLPLIPKESFDFGQGVTEEDGSRCREWAEKPCIANDFSADEDSLVRFETDETSVWRRSTRIRREIFSALMVLVQGDDGGCLRPYGFILNAGMEELAQRSRYGYSATGLSRSAPRSADRDSPALLRLSVCMLYASAESSRSARLSALPVHRTSQVDGIRWTSLVTPPACLAAAYPKAWATPGVMPAP